MQEYLKLLLILFGLVVHWERNFDHGAVQLDIAWSQVRSSGRPEHAVHLEAEEALFHRGLCHQCRVKLHSRHELVVSL